MHLKPTKRNLLVQFYQPPEALITAPQAARLSADSDLRTRIKVIEVSKELETSGEFAVGSFLLLRPNPSILVVSESSALGLIDASVIEAIVLDDTEI